MIDQWKKGAKYWDKAWNPVIGCEKVSEGCANCYAASMATRFPELQDADGGFTPHAPTCQKRPPKTGVVFVGNMTDLFGEWNTDQEIIDWTFEMYPLAANLLLTKRAERMARLAPRMASLDFAAIFYGITAENQARFDERVKPLLDVPYGGLRWWLSAEPLLESIDLGKWMQFEHPDNEGYGVPIVEFFDWVVVGAESGPNRRPCKIEWVEEIVDTCESWNVPVFVKQLDIDGKLVTDINKFPEHLQIRQVPWKERTKQ
jgi:protein gp37